MDLEICNRLGKVLAILERIDANLDKVESGSLDLTPGIVAETRDLALAGMARLDAVVQELK